MLGLEPSTHTAPISSNGMDPRLDAWDDGERGGIHAKLAANGRRQPLPIRQRSLSQANGAASV